SDILKPLMASGIYKDEKRALKDIVADYIRRKIDSYDAVILQMQRKHRKDFTGFSNDMQRRASVAKEDDWMEWKAAITMKEAWQQAFKKLLHLKTRQSQGGITSLTTRT